MKSRNSCPEILSLSKLWERHSSTWGTTNKMYGGFYDKKDWGTPKLRQTTPWYTTNSEYGRQVEKVRENIQKRLTGEKENIPSRSSLSSSSSSSSSNSSDLGPKTDVLAPVYSKGSPSRGLYTHEKERYRGSMPTLPSQAIYRLPPLENRSSLPPYTYTMLPESDKRVQTLEKSYYHRPEPKSGLGKRFMLGEMPRLWSNMGKLDRIPTPKVPDILTLETTLEENEEMTESAGEIKDDETSS